MPADHNRRRTHAQSKLIWLLLIQIFNSPWYCGSVPPLMFIQGKRSVLPRFSVAVKIICDCCLWLLSFCWRRRRKKRRWSIVKGRFHRTAFVPAHSCRLKGSQDVLFMVGLMSSLLIGLTAWSRFFFLSLPKALTKKITVDLTSAVSNKFYN